MHKPLSILLLAAGAFAQAPRIAPAERVCVKEEIVLAAEPPRTWQAGTVLKALAANTSGRVPAPGAFDVDSLVLRGNGVTLERGRDYLAEPDWGTLSVAPGSRVNPGESVTAEYCYSLRRIDALVRGADGVERVIRGTSHLTRPEPPPIPAAATHVANLYAPYFSDGTHPEAFPPVESAAQAVTATEGRVPRALDKLRAGKPLRIVTWGDSVTAGGDASTPANRYPALFERLLRERFPKAGVTVIPVAVGGSNSRQWLYDDRRPKGEAGAAIRWQRVIDAKPDLVTIEFVNDAGMKPEDVNRVYGDVLDRLRAAGSELILITPHFTRREMMGFRGLREDDARPYVLALRGFAKSNGVGLADASARWGHLWKEGIPYETLLNNGINHPDDRGHRLFAEELLKCFPVR